MAIVCPHCNADLPDDAVFCDQCGASLGAGAPTAAPAPPPAAAGDEALCPKCGAPTIPGEAFCDHCGASLAEPEVIAAPAAEPKAPAVPPAEPEEAVIPLAEEPAEEPPAEAAPDLIPCPACGAYNLPGSAFCSNCGIHMDEVPEPEPVGEPEAEPAAEMQPEVAEEAAPPPPPPSGQPRFIVRDTGAEIILPTEEGEFLIGREDPVSGVFPEIDMNPHEGEHFGVSRRHAQLTVDAGLYFIQDLDSTNFTFVDRQKLSPRTPTTLSNGDEVRLGKLVMTFLE